MRKIGVRFERRIEGTTRGFELVRMIPNRFMRETTSGEPTSPDAPMEAGLLLALLRWRAELRRLVS